MCLVIAMILILVYTGVLLRKQKTSESLKSRVLWRYFTLAMLFVFTLTNRIAATRKEWVEAVYWWLIDVFGAREMVNDKTFEFVGHDILCSLIGLSSLFVALVRVSEPIVWRALMQGLTCGRVRVKFDKYEDDSLSSFVNSAMNTEYVMLIVGGI